MFKKHITPLIAPVLVALLVASAANGAFWEWSKTASTNASIDPTINWAEGMSPSSVNDSARAMMARAAEYRDDISGSVTTAGILTAYTATSNQGFDATPVTGQLFAFTPHVTNGISATLAVDGGTAWPLQTAPGAAVSADTLVLGTPYTVKFNGTAWVLRNFYGNPFTVPIGALIAYTGSTAPNSNFILPFGQCISRTVYATYFAQVSTTFGACDGTTTFAAPDLRGQIPVALDNMGGSAANRLTNSANGCGTAFTALGGACANGNESRTLTVAQMPSHKHEPITVLINNASPALVFGGLGFTNVAAGAITSGVVNATSLGITATETNTGGGGAHATVMPVIGVYYILRVL